MRKLALYGSGDLGKSLLEVLSGNGETLAPFEEVFYVDDNPEARPLEGYRLVDFGGLLKESKDHDLSVAVCIGEPLARQSVANRVRQAEVSLATLVDSCARVSPKAQLGEGCIVCGWSSVGANTTIGPNTLVMNSHVSHNSKIGQSCVLNTGSTLSCHVAVGDQTFVSIGVMVREGVSIGSRVIVDMGAAVFLDVEDELYVTGNPARVMRRNVDERVFRG